MAITRRKIINHLSWHAGDQFVRVSTNDEFTDGEEVVPAPRDVQANSGAVRTAVRALVNAIKTELVAEEKA
jgi:hypothetical protein